MMVRARDPKLIHEIFSCATHLQSTVLIVNALTNIPCPPADIGTTKSAYNFDFPPSDSIWIEGRGDFVPLAVVHL